MSEDVTKLPKWAQSRISRLEDALASVEKTLAIAVGDKPSRIEVDRGLSSDKHRSRLFLRDNARIAFNLATDPKSENWHDFVEVNVSSPIYNGKHALIIRGGDTISVRPESSNVVAVQPLRLA